VNEKKQQQQEQERNISIAIFQAQDYASSIISESKALSSSTLWRSDLRFNSLNDSSSASFLHYSVSVSTYFNDAINNLNSHQQRQSEQSLAFSASESSCHAFLYSQSAETNSKYSYVSSTQQCLELLSMCSSQWSLSSTFSSSNISVIITSSTFNSNKVFLVDQDNSLHHHHYISSSFSAASIDQSQNKNVCQTCNKAFLWFSSLRIHSRSHIEEKSFKCSCSECKRAFNVRSNMKRHVKECHDDRSLEST